MTRLISLDGIAHFVTVAETGSFRAAGARLGISRSVRRGKPTSWRRPAISVNTARAKGEARFWFH